MFPRVSSSTVTGAPMISWSICCLFLFTGEKAAHRSESERSSHVLAAGAPPVCADLVTSRRIWWFSHRLLEAHMRLEMCVNTPKMHWGCTWHLTTPTSWGHIPPAEQTWCHFLQWTLLCLDVSEHGVCFSWYSPPESRRSEQVESDESNKHLRYTHSKASTFV